MQFKKITDFNIKDKILFIRTDMNVPISNNKISDDSRIKASLKTIDYALNNGAKVIIATHLGRPIENQCLIKDSVVLIKERLSQLLNLNIPLFKLTDEINFKLSNIVMLENVRCNLGEKKNNVQLGQKYASLCDIFVHDAFATAHRAESSTDAVGHYAKEVCAGLLMIEELEALTKATTNPIKPIVAIVGGSKVSSKLSILYNLANKVDYLIVGGGILNTMLLASGYNIGSSLVEKDLVPEAKKIIKKMQNRGAAILLPKDVVVAKELSASAKAQLKETNSLNDTDMILDIGPKFASQISDIIIKSGTIIWNGPVGVFELDQFAQGTKIIASAIAKSNGFSLAGGGDTIAALNKFALMDKISYVSTAGGALLEFLEGKQLPAMKLLEKC